MHNYNHNSVPESLRWLGIAEKLLTNNDLIGSKTFATRARESDPTLHQPDQILAIIDTLIAAETQVSVNNLDWYAILQLARRTHDSELIATQYHRLAVLLNPNSNKFALSEHAYKLVTEAWLVLSNPSRKFHFDNEIGNLGVISRNGGRASRDGNTQHNFMPMQEQFEQVNRDGGGSSNRGFNFMQMPQSEPLQFLQPFGQQQLFPQQQVTQGLQQEVHWSNLQQEAQQQTWLQPPFHWSQGAQTTATGVPILQPQARVQQQFGMAQMQEAWTQQQQQQPPQSRERVGRSVQFDLGRNGGDGRENVVNVEELPNFWTVCAYCYTMHEYAGVYAECSIRCPNCKKAFHAVKIDAPPVEEAGEDGYYRCWGYFPIGISAAYLEERKKGVSSWTPISTMFGVPKGGNIIKPKKGRNSGPWVYIDDDEEEDIFDGISSAEESDEDWSRASKNKKGRNFTRKVSTTKKVNQPQGSSSQMAQESNMGNLHSAGLAQEGSNVGVPNAGIPSVPNGSEPSVPAAEANDKAGGEANDKAAGESSKKRVSTQQSNQVELERMWRGWI
ncbi:hypothetical protein DCAR_0934505 [Daucus carota subsp. sativus]|uniref:Uncharacterized protein n=1 Tax=Daucus carota subsp. sativus TaxID=79200 RepID=A0A175YA31_DAUCS|nr:PREDICTED: uncharacterized protein LOC108192678 [Daucus carota subsp. sativus]WOH14975.1 hypothetical protein DCAR_0934505 [Daucus carota subsp. sativus]